MTTAIAVYNSDGCVGRCDARCHYATTAVCHCICGGRLHGKGAPLLADIPLGEMLETFAARNGHDSAALHVEIAPQQELAL